MAGGGNDPSGEAGLPAHPGLACTRQIPTTKERRDDLNRLSVFKGPLVITSGSLGWLDSGFATGDRRNHLLVRPRGMGWLLPDGQVPQNARKVIAQHDEGRTIIVADAPRKANLEVDVPPTFVADLKIHAIAIVTGNS